MMQDLFVLKKAHLDVESEMVRNSLAEDLGIAIDRLVVVNRYITQNLTDSEFHDSVFKVFAEKNADEVFFAWGDLLGAADRFIITEFLPGQFNMRADAARECLELIFEKFGARVKSQKIYLLPGTLDKLTEDDLSRIKKYLINPVEMREGSLAVTFEESPENRTMPETYGGFTDLDEAGLASFHEAKALAMSLADLAAIQAYFKGKGRQIRETELRVLDTYWSDHCRHTTFHTILNEIRFEDEASLEYQTYGDYLALRKDLNREEKPQSLMDLATIGAKYLQAREKCLTWTCPKRSMPVPSSGPLPPRRGLKTISSCSKMRPTITPRRSSPSAVPPPDWAGPSEILVRPRFVIRQCG